MKLSSFLNPDMIICGLASKERTAALDELLHLVPVGESGVSVADLHDAIDAREALSPTIVAPEIAFPHARCGNLKDLFIIIGTAPDGIDWNGQQVRFIALFLVREASTNVYLKAMSGFAHVLMRPEMQDKLIMATDPDAVIELIRQTEVDIEPGIHANDIMESDMPRLHPDQSLKEATDLLVETRRHVLPVVDDDNRYLGMVNIRALIALGVPSYLCEMSNVAFLADYEPFEELLKKENTLTVRDVMCTDVPTFHPETPIIQIAIRFVQDEAPAAPIVTMDGTFCGIVAAMDFITKIIRA